jgi:hypothetical protein
VGERRGAYSVSWGGGGNLKKRYYLEDLSIDGKITLKLILKIGCESVYWIDLARTGTSVWRL